MTINDFLKSLKDSPEKVEFGDVLDVIDHNFQFIPTSFSNGDVVNKAGQNNGSCKVIYFAKLHDLSKNETLHCFGSYYRNEVLDDLEGDSHQNIRNFMKHGWAGIEFDGSPLINSSSKNRK